jgi:propionyl-CoA carboxylase beta chain
MPQNCEDTAPASVPYEGGDELRPALNALLPAGACLAAL